MNIQFFQKIWKDSVWSKVISVAIIASITFLYNIIIAKIKNETIKDSLYNFWNYKIELWVFTMILLFLFVIIYFFSERFNYDNETLELDRKLFNQILKGEGMMDLVLEIKNQGFSSGPVRIERIEAMISFLEESKKPDFEFFHPKLNNLMQKIIEAFHDLDKVLLEYIFGANNHGWVSIPTEWEYEQLDRLKKAKKEIKEQEENFTKKYQEFVTEGRKVLKV